MKKRSTSKNRLTPHLFFLSALILLFSTPVFSQVKHVISVTKNKFTPQALSITVGDTVEWRNTDGYHNVNGNQTTYPMNPESFRNGDPASTNWTFSYVFTMAGKYDYQCDPHVGLGMVGTIEVAGTGPIKHIVEVTKNKFTPANLMINAGDTVEWRNIDGYHNVNGNQTTYPMNPESFRNGDPASTNWTFSYVFTMAGKHDYQCDPHVGLGMVGTIEVEGTVDDGINTLTVNFSGMNPHIGQTLWIAVIDKDSGKEIERKSEIVSVAFSMQISGLEMNHSYNVDFFADHNKNGKYDAPNADHAWRMELNDVMGDTTLNFTHNTNFTDIMWKNKLTVHFMGMNPHVGQTFQLAVIDKNSGMEVQRVTTVAAVDFMVDVYGIENGMSYNVDFFADHNKNGTYDAPPIDHAWRLELNNVMGDTSLMFNHNTSFTDIMWITTSVSDLANSTFKLYPNPASNKVTIESPKISSNSALKISIYDISGKLKQHYQKSFSNKTDIDIHDLNPGIYFFDLRTSEYQKVFRIVKY